MLTIIKTSESISSIKYYLVTSVLAFIIIGINQYKTYQNEYNANSYVGKTAINHKDTTNNKKLYKKSMRNPSDIILLMGEQGKFNFEATNSKGITFENDINLHSKKSVSTINNDGITTINKGLTDIQQIKTAQYQNLISELQQASGDGKIPVMEELWRLAPEVGIDDYLLTLLQLTTYDTDIYIREAASRILADLQQFKNDELSTEEKLVSQIVEIDAYKHLSPILTGQDGPVISGQADPNRELYSILPDDLSEKRSKYIDQLKDLAFNAVDSDTKAYAMMNLLEFDENIAYDVIQYQLLNSHNSDERFKALELLRSSIGSHDSNKIRRLLTIASDDLDPTISVNASTSLIILNNYTQTVKENLNSIDNSQVYSEGDSGINEPAEYIR